MGKRIWLVAAIFFLVLLAYCGFAQNQQAILAQLAQQRVSCRYDWDCRTLGEELIELDQNVCVGQEHLYNGRSDPLIPIKPFLWNELVGKTYTDYIQTGYKITFKCGANGYCTPDKVDYDPGIVKCKYGCLVTPVEKNGKVYSNFCVCKAGQIGNAFCDPSRGRHVYYPYIDWTCEKSIEIVGYCPIGSKCSISPDGKTWECEPLNAQEFFQQQGVGTTTGQSEGNVRYTMLFPGNLESAPIKVALIKNGRIIAERAISSMSAIEYINKYGPVNAANAYAFAQKLGLTALASGTVNSGTTTRTLSSSTSTRTLNSATSSVNSYRTAYSYRSNSGTYGSTYTYSNSYRNYANSTNSYGTYSSSSNTSSSYYRPTTTYSYTKPTISYYNYSRIYPAYSSYNYRRYSISSSSSSNSYSYNSRSNSTTSANYTSYRYYYARRFS